jgi:hypothetical protein
MNMHRSLVVAAAFALFTANVQAVTPKAAETAADPVGIAPDAPKPGRTKDPVVSNPPPAKPVKPARKNSKTEGAKHGKKPSARA